METWIWRRHEWGTRDPDWWQLQELTFQEILVQAELVVGKYIRTHRRKALDMYRVLWELLTRANGQEAQVSALADGVDLLGTD